MENDPNHLYRLDGVAHIAGAIHEEPIDVLSARIVPYLQMNVAYQLGLSINSQYVSGCLTDFERHIEGGRPAWTWFEELLGDLPSVNCIAKFTVKYTSMQETFSELLQGTDDETIRGACVVWPIEISWSSYQPTLSDKGPRVAYWRLRIDLLQPKDESIYGFKLFIANFMWMPYSLLDVVQVVHPKILEPQHMTLWRTTTALIYFAVIEWHQVDRVLPQLGGVQHRPRAALDIDFFMSKDGRSEDWRFLSHELLLGNPRATAIPTEAMQRGDDGGEVGSGGSGRVYDGGNEGGYGGHDDRGDSGQGGSSRGGGRGHARRGEGQAARGEAGGQRDVYGCSDVYGGAEAGGDVVEREFGDYFVGVPTSNLAMHES
ncbi:hypothetical protein Ahy_B10g105814 [Arachis hypogaea]|uniref:Aminotransferase-like plant mobile domain-containing protein n=1 Tax=Arachis hypogaea TaxID=3818 RepID=A0A444X8Z1_ARAHY|nr:hypothetical protein Ahy_B10g105814 [Arachis hypogaea]